MIILGIVAAVAGLVVLVVLAEKRARWSRKWENAIWKNLIGWECEEDNQSNILTKTIDGKKVKVSWGEGMSYNFTPLLELATPLGYANEWLVLIGEQQLAQERRLREDEEADTGHGVAWKLYHAIIAANQ